MAGVNSVLPKVNKIDKHTRIPLKLFNKFVWFTRGDVLSVEYRVRGYGFTFTGLCLKIKMRSLAMLRSAILLRNIVARVAVEISFAIYGTCRFSFKILDYARKRFNYRSSKLYYLRDRVNLETIIRVHN